MEQPTKGLNFAEYQYRVSNFENFRIYSSKSGRYHYFNFQKSFRFDCRDYESLENKKHKCNPTHSSYKRWQEEKRKTKMRERNNKE